MNKYKEVIMFTIFFLLISYLFLNLMGSFMGGVTLLIALTNISLFWTEVIFGDMGRVSKYKGDFKIVMLTALASGLFVGVLNYIIARKISITASDIILGILVLVPAFVMLFLTKILFYVLPEAETRRYLSLQRILVLSVLVDAGILGIVVGLYLSLV